MPLYEYACEGCGEEATLLQSVHATALDTTCPHCRQTRLVRLMSSFATRTHGNGRASPSTTPSPLEGEGRGEGRGGCGCTPQTCGCG